MGITLKEVIRSEKEDVDLGEWKSGHIPYASFPLSRVKSSKYKYGQQYKWRVIKFSALGSRFRILIVYNQGKQIFRSSLGVEKGKDIAILCKYEYHASEPGWHCHFTVANSDVAECGVRKSRDMRRKPKYHEQHSNMEFNVNEANAVTIVAERFKLNKRDGFL